MTYRWVDEAVARIVGILRDPHEQEILREHLAGRARLFSPERFMHEIRAAAEDAARTGWP